MLSARYWAVGDCSVVYYGVREGWPYSYGYYSNGNPDPCNDMASDTDLAAAVHNYTLPRAIRYGSVHVSATGGSATSVADSADLIYYDATGSLSPVGITLASRYSTYSARAVAAPAYLFHGREMWWLVGTTGSSWYDIVQFRVAWTYYVLA
jgi:hypothetical protein